ncbi:CoA transferase [Streptomyces tibetensis]|uniref:CoA transferase n=1 Tax=Streptomyces tibetensis TaxID=2382123 RepID=UPI003F4D3546
MANPATAATGRTTGPLDGLRFEGSGPPGVADALVTEHLRLLGARPDGTSGGRFTVTGREVGELSVGTVWGGPAIDEATVQAATGIMSVHGRRDGAPRGLAVDYAATATGVLAVQGLLAGLLARARGAGDVTRVEVSAERAGLLTVSQYLAAAGAEEGEAAELAPGGPPFTSADGTVFEVETLDPGVWAAFWRALDAPEEAIRRGWRPFQFRYATACAPFPQVLHEAVRVSSWERIRQAAGSSGADVCPLGSLAGRAAEYDGAAPWELTGHDAAYTPRGTVGGGPLAGVTVLEAGRRIQAPLAAHLLGLLGGGGGADRAPGR